MFISIRTGFGIGKIFSKDFPDYSYKPSICNNIFNAVVSDYNLNKSLMLYTPKTGD